ncbi:cysteine/glutathione ABC transporter ATP-binding protein/permease CydC [Vibrio sp.]|uniref:Glutathione/L-cysteine transport system ATP-binding/permease protein CydC n=1 Tax=Vibrio viridaestus TaxID=2487322 RepID=A0A3N9U5Q5_9VIBR|nr:cysteine/glutathione ABC transporter ATP-binding protein/permease CydC [Vibrio viridaestus]MDC0609679.1 cysteine/glutathione ABC transporter ATP-binding protein/permease CydC [Vibrio sp.]RQW63386.1 cysteine/glutathione ABC transporter ATP-binding protein/permease CydC [Vibrio viridaestus]
MRDLIPFLKLYRKHWFGLTLGMVLALLTLCASIGLLTLSGWFLSASAIAGLTIARETFNYMLPGAFVRGLAIGRTAGRWGERVVSHNATFKVLADLRIFFFDKLSPLIPGRVANLRDADLLNRLVADVDAMDHVYLRLISPMLVGTFGIIFLTLFLCWFNLQMGLVLGGILLVLLISWPFLFYKLGKKNGYELTDERAKFRVALMDWIQGFSELSIFGAEEQYRDRISTHETNLIAKQKFNAHVTGLAQALLLLTNGLTLVLMLWVVGDGIHSGVEQDPLIAMAVFATMASFELLMPIAGAFQYLGQTLSSARRLNEVLDAKPEVEFKSEKNEINHLDIAFKNVDFRYSDDESYALKDINLEIQTGKKLAIVGQTGSGKSTLIQLLSRYWDPKRGSVSIGGIDLTQWNESQLRAAISVVSQRVDILNGSLRDNLLIAKSDSTDEQLSDLLSSVGLDKLLKEAGLDTWLGDGGRQLSGGEKRRIGIARALLHDGDIILLDEPTEGLDKSTEQSIMNLLMKHFENKTVLFVTHRLVNLDKMDSICLIEQGQVVEYGSHNALLAQGGRYYQLNQTL